MTWMTVLKAKRNCLADKFSGNTYRMSKVCHYDRKGERTAKRLSM